MSAETDESLMIRYGAGDEAAFAEIYARHHRRLFGYLKNKGLPSGDAEEVFQAVWVKLHRCRFRYDPKFQFTAWLFTIARNALIDAWRRKGSQPSVAFEESMGAVAAESAGPAPDVPWSGVSAEERRILEWRYFEDESFEEIGRRLGVAQTAVRKRISRSLQKLREAFQRRSS